MAIQGAEELGEEVVKLGVGESQIVEGGGFLSGHERKAARAGGSVAGESGIGVKFGLEITKRIAHEQCPPALVVANDGLNMAGGGFGGGKGEGNSDGR